MGSVKEEALIAEVGLGAKSGNLMHITNPALRDCPHSLREFFTGWVGNSKREITVGIRSRRYPDIQHEPPESDDSLSVKEEKENVRERIKEKKWAIATTGAGLFSDGYVNNSVGLVITCLKYIYGEEFEDSRAISNVASLAFAGTVLGQLSFGYFADRYGRKYAMLSGTALLILFTLLAATAWGKGTSKTKAGGLFDAIAAYRFFVGIAIGSEYSSGSPAAAEACNALPRGHRNRWFCWFTNVMIDVGFLVSAVVPLVLVFIFGEDNLTPVWRITLAIGALPPLSLFYMRLKYKEGEEFEATRFRDKTPYWAVIKFYWFRVLLVSALWFLYDFCVYAFGVYSGLIINDAIGESAGPKMVFAWNILFNFFYIPGCFLGAYFSDYWGPRITFSVGVGLQSILALLLAGFLPQLRKRVALFTVIYGIFMTLGEFGPGNNIGLLAAKTVATPVRGRLYGFSAAMGKVGAFVGTYIFPILRRAAGGKDSVNGLQAQYWLSASMCLMSALIALLLLPPLHQEAVAEEDERFQEFLKFEEYKKNSSRGNTGDNYPQQESVTPMPQFEPVSAIKN